MENRENQSIFQPFQEILFVAALAGISLISFYHYLLFHSLAEIFSIVIAFGIFIIAWNTRQFMDNDYLLFLGIAYFFIGSIDLLHTLAYKNMGIFYENSANLPTQLWIIARYIESISLLIAPLFFSRKLNPRRLFSIYLIVISLLLGILFFTGWFPDCFIEGKGLTRFKKTSEYIICLILFFAVILLVRNRRQFSNNIFRLLVLSIAISIFSELSFTFYKSIYGLANLTGHLLKIISFYLLYKAIIESGLRKPYAFLFKNLFNANEQLNIQKKKLEAANATKDKFFTIIAHDLKNPFNSLLGYSDLLMKEPEILLNDRTREFALNINMATKKLVRLSENLLYWARSQTGRLEYHPEKIDLQGLVNANIDILLPNAKDKQIILKSRIEEPAFAYCDKNMISTVIRNLISNAIKYTHPDGEIRIQASKTDTSVELSVIDNGIGIRKEDAEKLFRVDVKYTNTGTSGESGTGLGLILCREFVEKNNGKIRVESEPDKGSCFTIALPAGSEKKLSSDGAFRDGHNIMTFFNSL